MVMRVVPNPGEDMYGRIADVSFQGAGPGPARLPGSPPFRMPPRGWSGPNLSYASGPVGPAHPPGGLPGPIYPATWKGHAWHKGPGVNYTGGQSHGSPVMYGGAIPFDSPDFQKFFKFGIVDNGLLILMTAMGVGMDAWIAEKLNVPAGWGPLIGASIGNAISDGVAGLADGVTPAIGVTLGALLPVIPVFVASSVMKKAPQDKTAQYILMGSSVVMVLWAFMSGRRTVAPTVA